MSNTKTSHVKPITLNTYNDRYGDNSVAPMYVVNRTEPRGNVAFTAQNDMGQPVAVVVPATFIPIDLTTQATKESLLKSTHFRRALNMGQLVIIETDSAESYLQNNKLAQSELRKLNKMGHQLDVDLSRGDNEELADIDLGAGSKKRAIVFEGDNVSSNNFVNAFIQRAAENSEESDDNLEREFLTKGLELPRSELELLRKYITRPAIVELIVQALDDAQ